MDNYHHHRIGSNKIYEFKANGTPVPKWVKERHHVILPNDLEIDLEEYGYDDYLAELDSVDSTNLPHEFLQEIYRSDSLAQTPSRTPSKSRCQPHLPLFYERYDKGDPIIGFLGEPSGKFDYYVKFTPPTKSKVPIIPTGCDTDSEDELFPPKPPSRSKSTQQWIPKPSLVPILPLRCPTIAIVQPFTSTSQYQQDFPPLSPGKTRPNASPMLGKLKIQL